LVRRTVVLVLVLVALTLLTISFRSPTSGALHDLQGIGSSALRPFQVAANRVTTPFRDAYDYVEGLTKAKAENARLKRQNSELHTEVLINAEKAKQYDQLVKILNYQQGPTFPKSYRAVSASVISSSLSPFVHQLTIAAGSSSGVRVNAPVVSGDGLVGSVTNVFPSTAIVTLLSDRESNVSARDLHTGVRGILHPGPGGALILDDVKKQDVVNSGDQIVTDGTRDPRYPSLYPFGIPIGRVSHVGALDTATFLQVQVQPFANLGSLDSVAVLVTKKRHG
jgi:rod shape-determining protein MreC